MNKQVSKLGKWSSISLVVGNMIGAGIFLTPAVPGSYGGQPNRLVDVYIGM
ncbi:MAG: hypothetical protein RIC80_09080 [Cyclobacteriaceae bacterium]